MRSLIQEYCHKQEHIRSG